MNKTIGDVRTLEDSENRNIGTYLETLDLTDEERTEVEEQFTALEPAVRQPTDSPVPLIVNKWP